MNFIWLDTTRRSFDHIWSRHFSEDEIIAYKLQLLDRIESRITLMKTSIPVKSANWLGSFKVIVDKYIVYYSFSENMDICYVEYFKHMSQISELNGE